MGNFDERFPHFYAEENFCSLFLIIVSRKDFPSTGALPLVCKISIMRFIIHSQKSCALEMR